MSATTLDQIKKCPKEPKMLINQVAMNSKVSVFYKEPFATKIIGHKKDTIRWNVFFSAANDSKTFHAFH